jgi:hypothetical protein
MINDTQHLFIEPLPKNTITIPQVERNLLTLQRDVMEAAFAASGFLYGVPLLLPTV